MHSKIMIFLTKITKPKQTTKTMSNRMSLNFLHRVNKEDFPLTDNILYKNYFLVNFPVELGVRYYDVISVQFLEDNICRFTIRDNDYTYPLYYLNKYKCKFCNFFKRKKDNIEIFQLNSPDMKIVYKNILTNICIVKINEDILTYKESKPKEITFDVKYKKRILTKHATNKEGE